MPSKPRYTGYQYETSPRKLQPEYEPPKNPYRKKRKSTAQKQKANQQGSKLNQQGKVGTEKKKGKFKILSYIAVGFAILFAISYRNSLINENFTKVQNLKKEFATLQKENEQAQVNLENNQNLSKIEQEAKERLGMQKLNADQSVYVSLPKKDYIETATEKVVVEEEENWFQKLISDII